MTRLWGYHLIFITTFFFNNFAFHFRYHRQVSYFIERQCLTGGGYYPMVVMGSRMWNKIWKTVNNKKMIYLTWIELLRRQSCAFGLEGGSDYPMVVMGGDRVPIPKLTNFHHPFQMTIPIIKLHSKKVKNKEQFRRKFYAHIYLG